MEEIPFVRSIAFGFWVMNGSRNESAEVNGISHFLEHMIFRGTDSRTAKRIADEMDAIGGQMNAYTSKEYTCYYTRVLDTHFDKALDILADMFFNSKYDPENIEKEKSIISEEINMCEDTPEDLAHDILSSQVFRGHALGYPILGTKETITSFERDTFVDFKNKHYSPLNTLVAVAGNFKAADMIKKIEKYFAGFSAPDYKEAAFNAEYAPALVTKEKPIEQIHLCMAFPGLPVNSGDAYTLSVLNTLFGGGMSSRLFQAIREERGLVYSIYAYAQSYLDTGLYTIYAALNPQQTSEAFQYISEEIKNLFSNRITEDQLKKTKDQLISNYVLSLESSASRMNSIGRSQLLLHRILSPDELISEIEKVSLDGLYRLAESMFDFEKMSVSAVGRISEIDFKGLIDNAK